MPAYELVLIVRSMPKNELFDCLKRTANHIWKQDGVLKKIEYLGHNKLPYAKPAPNEGERYYEGSYFLYHLSLKPKYVNDIRPELKLDLDIISAKFNQCGDEKQEDEEYECTLEEELLPPALRKSVRPLLENKNVRADVRR